MRTAYFLDHKLPETLTGNPLQVRLAEMLKNLTGMTTPLIAGIINGAVTCMEGDEVYLEVGCCQGASLIGALMDNEKRAVAVDNFSEFPETCNLIAFRKNIRAYGVEERITFYRNDYRQFFASPPPMKVGVYYYDGAHDYASEYAGIKAGLPFLVDGGLVLVDDTNWPDTSQAVNDILKEFACLTQVFCVRTSVRPNAYFWNGFAILARNVNLAK